MRTPAVSKKQRRARPQNAAADGDGGEGLAVSMALSAKLVMRQSQAMVLTPQLLQAIKLLQMPNLELTQFIENELASNPLLERAEEREEPSLEQVEPQADGFAEARAGTGRLGA